MAAIDVQQEISKVRQKREEFVAMTKRFEQMAAQDPEGYRRKLQAFSRLGTAYVLFILFLVLAVIGGLIAVIVFTRSGAYIIGKLGIVFAILAYGIFKALWVKFDPPTGVKITREDCPPLFAEVDRLSERLNAPKIDYILFNIDTNAAAAEVPRLGILGWPRFVLILGAPLLYRFEKDELLSVIAHELGHFSGRHGDLGRRIYRVYATWTRLGEHFSQHGGSAWLFSKFVKWYMPRLEAMSSAMRREHEYHADAAAVSAVGADAAGRAFMRLSTMSEEIGRKFWDPLRESAMRDPNLPTDLPVRFRERLAANWSEHDALLEIRADLAEETDADDSHPSLSQRLAKMGFLTEGRLEEMAANAARPPQPSAADAILGPGASGIDRFLNEAFIESLKEPWKAEFEQAQEMREWVNKTEAKRAEGDLSIDEERGLAYSIYRLEGKAAGEIRYRAFLEKYPADPDALFTLGEIQLDRDDAEGANLIREAIAKDERFYPNGYGLLYRHFRRTGNFEAIRQMKDQSTDAYVRTSIDESASESFEPNSDYEADPWEPEAIAKFAEQAEANNKIRRAYLVQRKLPGTGRIQHCVIVERIVAQLKFEGEDAAQKLARQIADFKDLGLDFHIFVPKDFKPWRRRFEMLGIAPSYERKG